jgi:hypothetical protein
MAQAEDRDARGAVESSAAPSFEARRASGKRTTPRQRKRINVSQRVFLREFLNDPSLAEEALARVAAFAARMRSGEWKKEPYFGRLESQLAKLTADPEAAARWYFSGWQRLLAAQRRAGRDQAGRRS